MERICKHIIIGILGLNSLSIANEPHQTSFWLDAGYNSTHFNVIGAAHISTDNAELMITPSENDQSVAPPIYYDTSSPYVGASAEYSMTEATTIGAHMDLTGQTTRLITLNPNSSVYQEISATIGLYSSYRWNNTSFRLGLDFDRVSFNELFSHRNQDFTLNYKGKASTISPKLVISSAIHISPHTRAAISAYISPPKEIALDDGTSSPLLSYLSDGAVCESGIKISISQSVQSLVEIL